MVWKVPLSDINFGAAEEQAVLDVLRRRWLTMGEETQAFENEFSNFLDLKHAIALGNATEALHLACLAAGIGPGDEVIVPSLTFVATSNAVLYCGGQVRFAEITSEDDLSISPESIEEKLTERTKAIIVMHYAGFPCRMPEIMNIAKKHNLVVIEDAAHAPGGSLDGLPLGAWGDVGCFSFFSNKNLITGEGGMLVTSNDELAERVKRLRSHGMTSLTWDRHQGHAYSYDVTDLGYNYRIDEVRSALGRIQLKKLQESNLRRQRTTEEYWEAFRDLPIALPFRNSPGKPAYHIFPILLPTDVERQSFIEALKGKGIQTSIHYPPIHQFRYYVKSFGKVSLPRTEAIASREVTLPLFPGMTEEQVQWVIDAVRSVF